MSLDRLREQGIMGVEWQMEQGAWCSLRWVDAESALAVPGSLCFHSAAPGRGERAAGARERGEGWQPDTSVWPAVWKHTGLFVWKALVWITRLCWKTCITVGALQVCLHFDDGKVTVCRLVCQINYWYPLQMSTSDHFNQLFFFE